MTSYFLKFAALGIPAFVALVWWKRVGVLSRGFYIVSWTNVICYLLWLTHMVLLNRAGGTVLVALLVAAPFFAAAFSLILVVWVRLLSKTSAG